MSLPRYPEYRDSGVEWLGRVPAHWKIQALKTRFDIVGGSTPKSDEPSFWDGDIDWLTPADLSKLSRFEVCGALRRITQAGLASCGTSLVPAGSIILSTRAPIGSLGLTTTPACTNQGCKALIPHSGQDARFAAYALSVAGAALNVRGKGTTFLELSGDELGRFPFPVPGAREQAAIAAFLDRETAKIDALIAEQEKLLALLAEKRQATISHAVTRGLDPAVRLKDSGIPWLGQVPVHWDIMPLARITLEKCDGPFGSGIKSDHYTDEGALVIRLQNIRQSGYHTGDAAYLDIDYFNASLKRHSVAPGDLLIAGLGDERNLVGRACVAPDNLGPALVKADCFRFRLIDAANASFVAAQLNASASFDAGTMATGTTRSRIPLSAMGSRVVALPPWDEQTAVVAHIDRATRRTERLMSEARDAIALLGERRAALITAAVTGQIDVRGAAV